MDKWSFFTIFLFVLVFFESAQSTQFDFTLVVRYFQPTVIGTSELNYALFKNQCYKSIIPTETLNVKVNSTHLHIYNCDFCACQPQKIVSICYGQQVDLLILGVQESFLTPATPTSKDFPVLIPCGLPVNILPVQAPSGMCYFNPLTSQYFMFYDSGTGMTVYYYASASCDIPVTQFSTTYGGSCTNGISFGTLHSTSTYNPSFVCQQFRHQSLSNVAVVTTYNRGCSNPIGAVNSLFRTDAQCDSFYRGFIKTEFEPRGSGYGIYPTTDCSQSGYVLHSVCPGGCYSYESSFESRFMFGGGSIQIGSLASYGGKTVIVQVRSSVVSPLVFSTEPPVEIIYEIGKCYSDRVSSYKFSTPDNLNVVISVYQDNSCQNVGTNSPVSPTTILPFPFEGSNYFSFFKVVQIPNGNYTGSIYSSCGISKNDCMDSYDFRGPPVAGTYNIKGKRVFCGSVNGETFGQGWMLATLMLKVGQNNTILKGSTGWIKDSSNPPPINPSAYGTFDLDESLDSIYTNKQGISIYSLDWASFLKGGDRFSVAIVVSFNTPTFEFPRSLTFESVDYFGGNLMQSNIPNKTANDLSLKILYEGRDARFLLPFTSNDYGPLYTYDPITRCPVMKTRNIGDPASNFSGFIGIFGNVCPQDNKFAAPFLNTAGIFSDFQTNNENLARTMTMIKIYIKSSGLYSGPTGTPPVNNDNRTDNKDGLPDLCSFCQFNPDFVCNNDTVVPACTCIPGKVLKVLNFTLTCVPICNAQSCGTNQYCNNLTGECSCNSGYRQSLNGYCVPIPTDTNTQGAQCTIFGDPHYRTFDGALYDFYGQCDYYVIESEGFSIQSRHMKCNGERSCLAEIAVQIGGNIIIANAAKQEILLNGQILVSDKSNSTVPFPNFPVVLENGQYYSALLQPNVYVIRSNIMVTVEAFGTGAAFLNIAIPPDLKGRVNGLCGDYDGLPLTFKSRTNIAYNSPTNAWADTFLVPLDKSLFSESRTCGQTTTPASSPACNSPKAYSTAAVTCSFYATGIYESSCSFDTDFNSVWRACAEDVCSANNSLDVTAYVFGSYYTLMMLCNQNTPGVPSCGVCPPGQHCGSVTGMNNGTNGKDAPIESPNYQCVCDDPTASIATGCKKICNIQMNDCPQNHVCNGIECVCAPGFVFDSAFKTCVQPNIIPAPWGLCTVWGDPHITTFNGNYYDFYGDCDYIYVKDPNFSFVITGKHIKCNGAKTCAKTLLIQRLGTNIEMQGSTVYVNSVKVNTFPLNGTGFKIYKTASTIVEFSDFRVENAGDSSWRIYLRDSWKTKVNGLCGTWSSTDLNFYNAFGFSETNIINWAYTWQYQSNGFLNGLNCPNGTGTQNPTDYLGASSCATFIEGMNTVETLEEIAAKYTSASSRCKKTIEFLQNSCPNTNLASFIQGCVTDTCKLTDQEFGAYVNTFISVVRDVCVFQTPNCLNGLVLCSTDRTCLDGRCICKNGTVDVRGTCIQPCQCQVNEYCANDGVCVCNTGFERINGVCSVPQAIPVLAYGVCTFWGDPHYTSFGGVKYDYYGPCDYTVVNSNSLIIQARHENCNGPRTCARQLAIQYKNSFVLTISDTGVTYNNQPILTFPGNVFNSSRILQNGGSYVLLSEEAGLKLTMQSKWTWRIELLSSMHLNIANGLCGWFTGQRNLWKDSKGVVTDTNVAGINVNSWGDSWLVQNSLFPPNPNPPQSCVVNTAAAQPCSDQIRVIAENDCSAIQREFLGCRLDTTEYIRSCVDDYCQLQDKIVLDQTRIALQDICDRATPSCNNGGIVCSTGESCILVNGAYICACLPGTVKTTLGCIAPCTNSSCGANQFCNGLTCECSAGYRFNGVGCIRISAPPSVSRGECIFWGDPHYTTFNGVVYHYYGQCDYQIMRNDTSNFLIEARHVQCNGVKTCASEIRVKLGNNVLAISNDFIVYNGTLVTNYPFIVGGYSIYSNYNQNKYFVSLPNGVNITLKYSSYWIFHAADQFFGDFGTNGLCGVWNKKPNYFKNRNGTIFNTDIQAVDLIQWADSFVAIGSLFQPRQISSCAPPKDTYLVCNGNAEQLQAATAACSRVVQEVTTRCGTSVAVDITQYVQSCIIDFCQSQDLNFVTQAIDAMASACANQNPTCANGGKPCKLGEVCQEVNKEFVCVCPPQNPIRSLIDNSCISVCNNTNCPEFEACDGRRCQCKTNFYRNRDGKCVPNIQIPITNIAFCTFWGDPHYRNFNGKTFDYYGQCDYTVAKSVDFEIQARHFQCNSLRTCASHLGIKFTNGDIVIINDGGVTLNGVGVSFPYAGTNFEILKSFENSKFSLKHKNGLIVSLVSTYSWIVKIPQLYFRGVNGLCGVWTGNLNEFVNPNGTAVTTLNQNTINNWGNLFAVQNSVFLKRNDTACSPHPSTLDPCPTSIEELAVRECSTALKTFLANSRCPDTFSYEDYLKSCVIDYCEAKNGDLISATIRALEEQCRQVTPDCNNGLVACSRDQVCTNNNGAYFCVCPAGTIPTTTGCIKACTNSDCGANEECVGGTSCSCRQGFVRIQGVCSPVIAPSTDIGVCYFHGDPHYVTFNGNVFDFYGQCDYTVMNDTLFYVETRHIFCNGLKTCASDVAVKVGSKVAQISSDRVVILDTNTNQILEPTLPYTSSEFNISKISGGFVVTKASGSGAGAKVSLLGLYRWKVELPNFYLNRTFNGLCGKWDRKPNLFTSKFGIQYNSFVQAVNINEWGNSWFSDSAILPPGGKKTGCEPDPKSSALCDNDAQKLTVALQACSKIREYRGRCPSSFDVESVITGCVADYCQLQSVQIVDSALATLLDYCQLTQPTCANGGKVCGTNEQCVKNPNTLEFVCNCTNGYTLTVDGCQSVCTPETCKAQPFTRCDDLSFSCVCIQGYYMSNGKCIEKPPPTQAQQALCNFWGDPHYTTFNGDHFDFYGKCDYVVLDSPQNNIHIQARHFNCNGVRTCASDIGVRIKSTDILISRNGISLSGNSVLLPYKSADFSIESNSNGATYALILADGTRVEYVGGTSWNVRLRNSFFGKVNGLCGVWDGAPNRYFFKNGTLANNIDNWANSWLVTGTDPVLLPVGGQSNNCVPDQSTANICDDALGKKPAIDRCSKLRDIVAERRCPATLDIEAIIRGCVVDFCQSGGDETFVLEVEKSLKGLCEFLKPDCNNGGVTCGRGQNCSRNDDGVFVCQCPTGFVFTPNGCEPKCDPIKCSGRQACVGNQCICNGGFVRNQFKECVPVSLAPAAASFGRCGFWGDPHYTSFDNIVFDFYGRCDYIVVQSPTLTAVARHIKCGGVRTCASHVGLLFNSVQVVITQGSITVNGAVQVKGYTLSGVTVAESNANIQQVKLSDGSTVTLTGVYNWEFLLSRANFFNQTNGLCGLWVNNPSLFIDRNNVVYNTQLPSTKFDINTWANSWQVSSNLLSFTGKTTGCEPEAGSEHVCDDPNILSSAVAACTAGLKDYLCDQADINGIIRGCAADFCQMNDQRVIDAAKLELKQICATVVPNCNNGGFNCTSPFVCVADGTSFSCACPAGKVPTSDKKCISTCNAGSCAANEQCAINLGICDCKPGYRRVDGICQLIISPPVQPESIGICSLWGDPHITTFNGILYHFYGKCDYTYVKGVDLEIVGRHVACNGPRTCAESVAAKLPSNDVVTLSQGKFTLNGVPIIQFPFINNNLEVQNTGVGYRVIFGKTNIIEMAGLYRFYFKLSAKYFNATNGLCGIWNGQSNLFKTSFAVLLDASKENVDVTNWAETFKVNSTLLPTAPSTRDCGAQPNSVYDICDGDAVKLVRATQMCQKIRDTINLQFGECGKRFDIDRLMESCVIDVCAATDSTSLNSYLQEALGNVKVLCGYVSPNCNNGGTQCNIVNEECRELDSRYVCVCKDGFIRSDKGCVKPCNLDECPTNSICLGNACACKDGFQLVNRKCVEPAAVLPNVKDATCTFWGDPHYTTFTGRTYHYYGKCDYVVLSSQKNNVTVHARHFLCNGLRTCASVIGIAIGSNSFVIDNQNVQVNGVFLTSSQFPYQLNGITVRRNSGTIFSLTYGTFQFDVLGIYSYSFKVGTEFANAVNGLCGSFGNNFNFVTRDKPSVEMSPLDTNKFADSWIVTGADLQILPPRQDGDDCKVEAGTEKPCDGDQDKYSRALKTCNDKFDQLKRLIVECSDRPVDVTRIKESCAIDFCQTGSFQQVDDAINEFQNRCKLLKPDCNNGGIICKSDRTCKNISNTFICSCGDTKVEDSAGFCVPKCQCDTKTESCVGGTKCVCKDGLKRINGLCVLPPKPTGSTGRCGFWGDPHFTTFGGLKFDFHGRCDYVAFRGGNIEVHVRHFNCTPTRSCAREVAIKAANLPPVFLGAKDDVYDYNGSLIIANPYINGDMTVRKFDGDALISVTWNGFRLERREPAEVYSWQIFVTENFKNSVQGLCGDWSDGVTFTTGTGTKMTSGVNLDLAVFANSWRVTTNPIFKTVNSDSGCSSSGAVNLPPCDGDLDKFRIASEQCASIQKTACTYDAIDKEGILESCITDMCASLNPLYVEAALDTLKQGCNLCDPACDNATQVCETGKCLCKEGFVPNVADPRKCVSPCSSLKCGQNEECDPKLKTCRCVSGYRFDYVTRTCKTSTKPPKATAICSAWGDPHYTSFKNDKFDFQGPCDYVLVKSFVNTLDFLQIQQRNKHCGDRRGLSFGKGVACTSDIAVQIAGGHVVSLAFRSAKLNGVEVTTFPKQITPTVSLVQFNKNLIGVQANDSSFVKIVSANEFSVQLTSAYFGRVDGLCGRYDDEFTAPKNKYYHRDGTTVSTLDKSMSAFGDSWQVQEGHGDPLLIDGKYQPNCPLNISTIRKRQVSETVVTISEACGDDLVLFATASEACEKISSARETACGGALLNASNFASNIPVAGFVEGCIFDVCLTGDVDVAHGILDLLLSNCESLSSVVDIPEITSHSTEAPPVEQTGVTVSSAAVLLPLFTTLFAIIAVFMI